jgi:hypothetical protein
VSHTYHHHHTSYVMDFIYGAAHIRNARWMTQLMNSLVFVCLFFGLATAGYCGVTLIMGNNNNNNH